MRSLVIVLAVLGWFWVGAWAANEEGLVAHYPFDEGSGSVLHDRSGHGNNGKIVGGAEWAKGPWGTALRFDGQDDYVDCGARDSLHVPKTGSILVWFKPQKVCQGGLLAWTAGPKPPDQRLVLALNTYKRDRSRGPERHKELGVYMADGEGFYEVHQSNFHRAYFPPHDQWLHLGVTWDGRSVNVYRDGVWVYTRFQAIVPKTSGIALWLGRCVGTGGPSDYFKGLIDDTRVYNRALSDQEVYRLYVQTAKGRGKDTAGFGTIRIRPKSCPRPGTIFADLDYRGLTPTPKRLTIQAELLDAKQAVAARGTVRMLPVWGRAEVVFDAGNLPAGDYTVRAVATKGKAGTASVHWPGRAEGWAGIKVLNNLCWELLNESLGKNPKKEYTFRNPRRGWVLFQTEAQGKVRLSIRNAKPATIHSPEKQAAQEAMRWLDEGDCRIKVSGDGTLKKLIVRSVPTLTFGHYPHVGPGTANDHDFLVKHVLPHVNTITTHNYGPEFNTGNFRSKWANELGRRALEMLYPRSILQQQLKEGAIKQQIYDFLAKAAGMNKPEFGGVLLDEFDPGNDRMAWYKSYYDEWIEVCTKIQTDPKFAGRLVIPYFSYNMFDYQKSSAFLRNIIGNGSYLDWEVYLNEQENEAAAWVYINEGLAGLMDDWERAVPGFTERAIIALSYLRREDCLSEADFKVFLDMQFEHLATRPEFFGLAGIEAYVSHNSSSEEYVRWAARLQRHYGLEGHTTRLSKDPYTLTHIRNGDFRDGTKGWTVKAAEQGSAGVKSHRGLGVLQGRYSYRAYTETTLLWMRRSKEKPNIISQEIRNLKPGRLYSVHVTTGDWQQLVKGKATEQQHAVSIRIEGADAVTDWYRTKPYKGFAEIYRTWRSVGPFNGKNRYWLNNHKHVFRAKGPTARLVISDWKSDKEPGGPIGQELLFNFIQVQPYLGK